MKALIILLMISIGFESYCQQLKILDEKLISRGIDYPLNEPHLITDPNNPEHLLVAAILTEKWEEGKPPESYIVLLQSWDNGQNWEEKHFDQKIILGADPWLAMNKKGTLILTSLNKLSDQRYVYLLAYVSKDGGKNWDEDFLNLGFAHDRQSITVDPKTQDFIIASAKYNLNGDNKKIAGIMINRMASDGSFREANWHPLSNIDKNNGTPMITREGDLLIPYVDYMANEKMLETRRNWLIRSRDLGRSFSESILISEGGTFPNVVLDTSKIDKTKLHYLKPKGAFREYLGYDLRTSSDLGYTWSDDVNIDQFEGEDPYIRSAQLAVNNKGIIGVFWFDGRVSEKGGHNLYFTYSEDGVEFRAPTKITSQTSFPNPQKNGMVDKRWPVGGDYFGLNTVKDGAFRVVWVDYRNGKPQLFYAKVKVE